jgi:threonine dehydrogenase-like Zn-dependent dehydrogenase
LELRDVPDPQPDPGTVVVKVHSAGICGSDVHGVESGMMPTGRTIGHELCGTVVDFGAGVDEWSVGTRVAVNPIGSCGHCEPCIADLPFMCRAVPNIGLSAPGGFAEYVSVPQGQIYALPDTLELELGCRAEPLAVALRAVALAEVRPGDTAVVYGVGSIGLHVIIALRALGAGTIVAIGRSEARRAAALTAGADVVLDGRSTSVTQYSESTGARFKHAFECSGALSAIEDVLPAMSLRASIIEVALTPQPSPISLKAFVHGEFRLIGSCAFSKSEYLHAVELLSSHGTEIGQLITDRIALEDAPSMIVSMRNPSTNVGVIVQPWV